MLLDAKRSIFFLLKFTEECANRRKRELARREALTGGDCHRARASRPTPPVPLSISSFAPSFPFKDHALVHDLKRKKIRTVFQCSVLLVLFVVSEIALQRYTRYLTESRDAPKVSEIRTVQDDDLRLAKH